MALIGPVRAAMAAALNDRGIRAFAYGKSVQPVPCVDIALQPITYQRTFGAGLPEPGDAGPRGMVVELGFTIRLYASQASDRSGQDALDALLDPTGPRSVRAALLADPTLGGLVETVQIPSGADNYGYYESAGTTYYGAEMTVAVLARGN